MQLTRRLIPFAVVAALWPMAGQAGDPACVFVDEADPNSKIWFDDDGALVTERLGNRTRYPTSMGAGTGIMTRMYQPEDPSKPEAPILVYDLTDIAKPGAPQSIVFAFGNVYLQRCGR
ncbi:MAG: hypothetical protein JJ900_06420 [Rhodospirillales bacterium]|nr:hypothetical protein [Rhodospirillales bacterium]MBO6786470.1 hypothetical protein [Rhodospirillales bacterium]